MFPYPINDLSHELAEAASKEISNKEMKMTSLLYTLERLIITKTMKICNYKKSLTSRVLGISRVTLDYKLKEIGFTKD